MNKNHMHATNLNSECIKQINIKTESSTNPIILFKCTEENSSTNNINKSSFKSKTTQRTMITIETRNTQMHHVDFTTNSKTTNSINETIETIHVSWSKHHQAMRKRKRRIPLENTNDEQKSYACN